MFQENTVLNFCMRNLQKKKDTKKQKYFLF